MGNRKRMIEIGVLLLLAGGYMDYAESDLGTVLQRPRAGEVPTEYEAILDAGDTLEGYRYQLEVAPEIPNEEQTMQYMRQAQQEIEETFCRKGQDVEYVTESVYFQDSYVNGLVEAEWFFTPYEIVASDGTFTEELIPKEGVVIDAQAQLFCGEKQELYCFSFCVYPKERSEEEQLLWDIEQAIVQEQQRTGTDTLQLPEEVDGVSLTWKAAKSYYFLKMLLLFVVLLVGTVLAEKEQEKKQKYKREQQMQLDYPEIVSKLLILHGSGMSIKQAWSRIAAIYLEKRECNALPRSEALEEMVYTDREILDGESERVAIQKFGERIGVRCYQRLSRLLVENMQKGAKGLAQQLEMEAEDAFEERRNLARKLGEEAGTKLLFPMMMLFGIVIAIIMVPAMLSFQG